MTLVLPHFFAPVFPLVFPPEYLEDRSEPDRLSLHKSLEMGVSRNGGVPNSWMVYNGKSY